MNSELDQERIDAFAQQMLRDASRMMLLPLAYIGDQLDLFEALDTNGPVTPDQLAERTSCDARYLEEWLSAMASAGWIEYEPNAGTFTLPPEHALFLVDEDSPHHMAGMFERGQANAEFATTIEKRFREGGGLELADHHPASPRITDRVTAPTFKNVLPEVWIKQLLPGVDETLREGGRAADVGCGSGQALVEMARAYPESRFEGFEPNERSAQRARGRIQDEGLEDRITVHRAPAEKLPTEAYDLITTFDVIHDLHSPTTVLRDIYDGLRSDGTYLMQEINASEKLEENQGPLGTMLYSISTMYCLPMSSFQDGAAIGTCMGEPLAREMCEEVGFTSFRRLEFDHRFFRLYAVRK